MLKILMYLFVYRVYKVPQEFVCPQPHVKMHACSFMMAQGFVHDLQIKIHDPLQQISGLYVRHASSIPGPHK